jgi:hypothetical protein
MMSTYPGIVHDGFYRQAFDELEAVGHLDPNSHKEFGGCPCSALGSRTPVPPGLSRPA